jgi:molecular chaperone DnaJ
MSFQTTGTCQSCRGAGKIIKNPCQKCRGSGFSKETKRLTVSIPAGIDHGQRIALSGQGSDGKNGGATGDLIITVAVRRHPEFERDGYNIHCEVPVSIVEATLGAEIKVPTLEGDVTYEIPEGTQYGTSFTLRGKGIPYVNNSNRRGDLIFTVTVEIPKGLNEKQKEAMRAFAEAYEEGSGSKRKKGFWKK